MYLTGCVCPMCLSAGEGVLPVWTNRTLRLNGHMYIRLYVFGAAAFAHTRHVL